MDTLVKVSGYGSLVKDLNTGAIVNIDKKSYEQHMIAKNIARQKILEQNATKESISSLQQQVEVLKEDISSIKEMLMQLTGKGK